MVEYDLIKRVCNLTCSKEDVARAQTTIKYDTEYPFKKYYNENTIVGAINKYLSHEWDDITLSSWACIYLWILSGGFDDNLKEKLTPLEEFLKDVITWDLDGMAFFDDSFVKEEGIQELYRWIELHKTLNHIWETRNKWKGVYAAIGAFAKFNADQYVVLINDAAKEYIIIYSEFLENKSGNNFFKYVSEKEINDLIVQLKEKKYTLLSCSEEFYYSDISKE